MRAARRAGRYDATPATIVASADTATSVGGSAAPTPNSSAEAARASHQAPARPTARPPDSEHEPLTGDHPADVAGTRPERHAHADLVRACHDGMLDQRVESERGERERHDGAGQEQRGLHAALAELGVEPVADQAHAVDHGLGVDAAHGGAQRAGHGQWIGATFAALSVRAKRIVPPDGACATGSNICGTGAISRP